MLKSFNLYESSQNLNAATKSLVSRLFFAALLLTGCQTLAPKRSKPVLDVPAQAFPSSFEDVWQATHVAMIKYRLQVDNQETGLVMSELSADSPAYQPPFPINSQKVGRKSQIEVRLIRGQIGARPSTKVIVQKRIEQQSTIVDDSQTIVSDGWEERAILYRIERELTIFRALQRFQKRQEYKQKKAVEASEEKS